MQIIAQSINIPNLSDEAAQALAPDVDYRLREIIQVRTSRAPSSCRHSPHETPDAADCARTSQEAMKCMSHSKRTTLKTIDIDHALRLKNIEVPPHPSLPLDLGLLSCVSLAPLHASSPDAHLPPIDSKHAHNQETPYALTFHR